MSAFRKLRFRSINAQIFLSFFTLTILIIGVETLAYEWIRNMHLTNKLKESFLQLKESQMLLKSASNEFILREKTNEMFFATGKSVYLERYSQFLSQLQNNIDEILRQNADLNAIDENEFTNLRSVTLHYNDVFNQMVARIKTRGYGSYGLIGEFDKSISNLLQYNVGNDNMAVINLQLFVKDYLLSGDEKLVENISNEVFNFTMAMETRVADQDVEKVTEILTNYENVFQQLTEVDRELGIYTGGGLQASLFSEMDVLDQVIQLEKTNARIQAMHEGNLSKVYLSFLLVVGAAAIAAIIINKKLYRSIVQPIQNMKSVIARMSRGEIPDTRLTFRLDDLNEMAQALNNLVRGSKNYQEFANNIGKGNLDTPFTPLSDRDILGASLLAMRKSLKTNAEEDQRRTWAAQGLAELSSLLRTQSLESELYDKILQFIVRYTGSNQGGLFLITPQDGTQYLKLVACYAWDKKKHLEKMIPLDHGMIGQCASEKEVIQMTNFPAGYIRITSGLGDAHPNALLMAPMIVKDKVLGVLEIASFKPYESHEIELIKKFCESVAAAVNVENINREMRQMLEESQLRTEHLRAQKEELRQNQQELQETININSKLLSVISHDIRGPFASIKGLIQLYNKGLVEHEELKTHLSKIESLITSTDMLFSNILQWSIYYIDNRSINARELDLSSIVSTNVTLFKVAADSKGINLINGIPKEIQVMADEPIINLVLRNFISNAIKFTENGTIRIDARQTGNIVEVQVKDTGIGMSPTQVSNLFKWEIKHSSVGTRSEKGAGVGLLICKEFIEHHGGRLHCSSQKGVGTVFSFTLPAVAGVVNGKHQRLTMNEKVEHVQSLAASGIS